MVEKIKKKFKPTKVIDAGFWEPFERAGGFDSPLLAP